MKIVRGIPRTKFYLSFISGGSTLSWRTTGSPTSCCPVKTVTGKTVSNNRVRLSHSSARKPSLAMRNTPESTSCWRDQTGTSLSQTILHCAGSCQKEREGCQ